jgi:hypothetical protein
MVTSLLYLKAHSPDCALHKKEANSIPTQKNNREITIYVGGHQLALSAKP